MEDQRPVWSSRQLALWGKASSWQEERNVGEWESGQAGMSFSSVPAKCFLLDSKKNVPEPPQLCPDLCAADAGSDNQMI